MSITLKPELADLVRQKVDRGLYGSVDETIQRAIDLLDAHDRLADLRAKLQVGIDELDRGEGIPFTIAMFDDIDREVDDRLARGERPNPDVCP